MSHWRPRYIRPLPLKVLCMITFLLSTGLDFRPVEIGFRLWISYLLYLRSSRRLHMFLELVPFLALIIKFKFFVVFKLRIALLPAFQSFSRGVSLFLLNIFTAGDMSGLVAVAMYSIAPTASLYLVLFDSALLSSSRWV